MPSSRIGRALLVGPSLVAVGLAPVMAYLTGVFDARWSWDESFRTVLVYLHNVMPSLALAGLICLASRRMSKGMPVVAVGTAVFVAAHVLGLLNLVIHTASTLSGLALLFGPFYTGPIVVFTAFFAQLVHVLRDRRVHRTGSFPRQYPNSPLS